MDIAGPLLIARACAIDRRHLEARRYRASAGAFNRPSSRGKDSVANSGMDRLFLTKQAMAAAVRAVSTLPEVRKCPRRNGFVMGIAERSFDINPSLSERMGILSTEKLCIQVPTPEDRRHQLVRWQNPILSALMGDRSGPKGIINSLDDPVTQICYPHWKAKRPYGRGPAFLNGVQSNGPASGHLPT